MDNVFHLQLARNKSDSTARILKRLNPHRNTDKMQQMALASSMRANNWSKEKLMQSEALNSLNKGSLALINPTLHNFRERNRPKEISTQEFLVKNYLPDDQRATQTCKAFQSSHLDQTPYQPTKPFVAKPRKPEVEVGPDFRFGFRAQDERVAASLGGTNRLIDAAARDNKMLISPRWKENNKEKWYSTKDFDLATCLYQGKKSSDPWPAMTGGINIDDPYIDGFEVTGDVSRKRKKNLELSPCVFSSTISPSYTPKGQLPSVSNTLSIRASKSAKFFGSPIHSSEKIYPQSLKQMYVGSGEPMDLTHSPANTTPDATAIKIQHAWSLSPLRESPVPSAHYKQTTRAKLFDELDKFQNKTPFTSPKKRNNKSTSHSEYIKQTVGTYFQYGA